MTMEWIIYYGLLFHDHVDNCNDFDWVDEVILLEAQVSEPEATGKKEKWMTKLCSNLNGLQFNLKC